MAVVPDHLKDVSQIWMNNSSKVHSSAYTQRPSTISKEKTYRYGVDPEYWMYWDGLLNDQGKPTNPTVTINEAIKQGRAVDPIREYDKGWSLSGPELVKYMGPDFMSNKFDAFFWWKDDNKGGTTPIDHNERDATGAYKTWKTSLLDQFMLPPEAHDYQKEIVNHRGFAVRITNLEYPASYNDEYTENVGESQIRKIRATKINKNITTFKLRLDENLYWLDEIQNLAGRTQTLNSELIKESSSKSIYNTTLKAAGYALKRSGKPNYQVFFSLLANNSWHPLITAHSIKQPGLCLLVRMSHLMTNTKNNNKGWVNAWQQHVVPVYAVFENVKFTGTSDAINYDQRGANIQDITVEFVFKRKYLVNPQVGSTLFGQSSSKSFIETTLDFESSFQSEVFNKNYDRSLPSIMNRLGVSGIWGMDGGIRF